MNETRPEMDYDQFLDATREALDGVVANNSPMQVRYDAESELFYACEPGEPAGGINGIWAMEIDTRTEPADVLNADVFAEVTKLISSDLEDIAAGLDEYEHNAYLERIYRLNRDAEDARD